ncbi:hypothetical protein [Streptomyces sp. NPDC058605]|uniref:hypothetical protein n=1 Tax=unclassified Streptomyces TaxID=2593676 RepID=UPI00365428B2
MDSRTYNRTQKVLNTLNQINKTEAEKRRKNETFSREEFVRLLEQLHASLEEMFWAGDFKRKEGDE